MACVHLRKLYQLCEDNDVKLSGSDLVRIVCHQCGVQEVCPATILDETEDGGSPRDPEQSTDGTC
jgi:hypothetical protein